MSTSIPHVGIAGAGLAGRLLAWRLLRAGCRVSLFDARARGDRSSAGPTAAAMLSPTAELAAADAAIHELGMASLQLWPHWLQQLHAAGGREVYFRREGTLVVAHRADRGALAHYASLLRAHLPRAGADGLLEDVDASRIAALEPLLDGRFADGLFLPQEGQLANDQLYAALESVLDAMLAAAGGAWHEHVEIVALAPHALHDAHGVRHDVDLAVDCRGVGARADVAGLHGVRGEVLTVSAPGVELRRPVRLIHPRYALYVAPRPGGQFIVGATELDSEDAGAPTLRSTLELGSALYSVHPEFGEARVQRLAASLRPALPDHQPIAAVDASGVWRVNGLFRHGYLIAPALVQRVARDIAAALELRDAA
ncbi:tRNA 5-methylaminomethyl-2-thiouridine biosynthesis bifunctional protein MnmC [mine drainage metagenome]|jgi:glycine oxidase|uniref:tRNA 5-methylaminomethyl-2-thiouridine biosynthesis bifunctional protein MnmC n=1 Tax=mine drainage metagenome TaxID=410659 RepID=A0A1J5QKZ8_9ZZZZ